MRKKAEKLSWPWGSGKMSANPVFVMGVQASDDCDRPYPFK